jgi:hypothetical protein
MGDNWLTRGSPRTPDGKADPNSQLTIMNTRLIALLAPEKDNWQWAGDQLFLDLDLSFDNLPAGARLALGEAVLEVTEQPHNGCVKFSGRFGADALKFISSPDGRQLRLRGIYVKVVQPGMVCVGQIARKL